MDIKRPETILGEVQTEFDRLALEAHHDLQSLIASAPGPLSPFLEQLQYAFKAGIINERLEVLTKLGQAGLGRNSSEA